MSDIIYIVFVLILVRELGWLIFKSTTNLWLSEMKLPVIVLVLVNVCHGWNNNKCERISVSMCQDLGYNTTVMPNFMGDNDQIQAEKEVSSKKNI